MSDEKQKYANGSSLNTSEMSKEERLQAIEYWCEGNQGLRKLLLYFNEKNIETVGCCSGHDKDSEHLRAGKAYLAIKLGEKEDDKVLNFLAKVEEKDINVDIAFKRGRHKKYFCILCSNEIGYNESFFEQLLETCKDLEQGMIVSAEIKKKYEMLKQLLFDERAIEGNNGTEYSFSRGGKDVRGVGVFKYSNSVVNIPVEEIIRMGQCLINNPGDEIPHDFYSEKIKKITYPISEVKAKAQVSKQPLAVIKQAFQVIRNAITRQKESNVMQEGGRND